jgi:methionine-S-sulfoxide reductase
MDLAAVNKGRLYVPRGQRNELDTFLFGSSGPMWYRGLVLDGQEDSISSAGLDRALAYFKVKSIVVGHTTVESVRPLHGGRVLAIDAGIQHRQGEGLFIEKGKAYRALKDGSRAEILFGDDFVLGGRMATATLAGGCFWGMEELFRQQPGVLDVEAGYTGGAVSNPTYEQVKAGKTGHAEAIKISFDPSQTTYETLLKFYFRMHDPTTLDRQGEDRGSQYRSVIFVHDGAQREAAERAIAEETASGFWPKPIVTKIAEAGPWWKAEEYHQDYLVKNPGGYTCHWVRE